MKIISHRDYEYEQIIAYDPKYPQKKLRYCEQWMVGEEPAILYSVIAIDKHYLKTRHEVLDNIHFLFDSARRELLRDPYGWLRVSVQSGIPYDVRII
jgi:hypothetical protein